MRRRRALDATSRRRAPERSRGARSRSWTPVALRRATPRTRRSTRCASTISGRTSTARTTAARRGREIVAGIDSGAIINVVREDPKRRGLLFAGSETQVWVSFDDGDHWSSLRLNMPATSIRDLVIKDDDIVVGTHGRSFWILDDIAPLRQITPRHRASGDDIALRAALAYALPLEQVHRHADPARRAAGENPPDGAIIDYYLGAGTSAATRRSRSSMRRAGRSALLEPRHLDGAGRPRQHAAVLDSADAGAVGRAGLSSFRVGPHYERPAVLNTAYPISAVLHDTPREPRGPWALPGRYTVRLTAGGHTFTQPLTVRMDPRVKTPMADLQQQFATAQQLADEIRRDSVALAQVRALRAELRAARERGGASVVDAVAPLDAKAAALEGAGGGGRGGRGGGPASSFSSINGELATLYGIVHGSDRAPTTQALAAVADLQRQLASLLASWSQLRARDVPAASAQLERAGLPKIGGTY